MEGDGVMTKLRNHFSGEIKMHRCHKKREELGQRRYLGWVLKMLITTKYFGFPFRLKCKQEDNQMWGHPRF